MARVHKVQKSAKEHTCGKGHVIPKGEPYQWAKPGFRTRRPLIRCMRHPFRDSDLATGLNQEPLAAREELEDTLDGLEKGDYDSLREAVESFQSALDDYVAAREEGLEAWENGNSALEELRDNAQAARDDFEPDVDEFSDEEPEEFSEPEPQEEDFETEEDYEEAHGRWTDAQAEQEQEWSDWDQSRDQHWEDAVEGVREAAMGLDL